MLSCNMFGLTDGTFLIKLFTILIATILALNIWVKWRYRYWKNKGLHTPPVKFLVGNASNLVAQTQSSSAFSQYIYDYFKSKKLKHGGIYMTITPVYCPIDIHIIKCILQNDFQYFVDRGVYMNERDDPLSAHLFSLEGTKWKTLRSKLSPTFTSGKMKLMFETLVDCSKELNLIMDETIGAPVDIKDILARFTTDIIGSCAFGIDCNSLKDPNNEFRVQGKAVFELTVMENIKQLLTFAFPDVMTFFRTTIVNAESAKFFLKVVEDTVKYRETNNIFRKDFMHLLIQLKNRGEISEDNRLLGENEKHDLITFEQLAAQAFIFFVAGFETSSTTMTFCLFELAVNPEVQSKIRQEINDVLERHNDKITYEAIMEMHYMEKAINETLRKYPPLPSLVRVCTHDYKVPGTDVIIEKGTKVSIPVYGIQHDEQYYPDPEKFDPDRFNEETEKTRPSCTFLPFGEGPRICIGLRFGMMQTKVGLTVLLKNYKFSLNAKTSLPIVMNPKSFIMSTQGGIWLDYEKVGSSSME